MCFSDAPDFVNHCSLLCSRVVRELIDGALGNFSLLLLKISKFYRVWFGQVSHVLVCESSGTANLCWLSLVIALSLQICIFFPSPSNAASEAFKPIKRKLK